MNIWDILLTLLLAAALALALRRTIRVKKSGGCAGCPNSGGCGGCAHCAAQPPRRQSPRKDRTRR